LKELTNLPVAPFDMPMLLELPNSHGVIMRDFVRLTWGDGAFEIYAAFEKSIRQFDEEEREIWTRAPEIAVRNATKVAFFRGSRVVEVEDMTWAIAVVTKSTEQLQQGHREYSKEDLDQADLVRRIRDKFKRNSRQTWGNIRKHCERQTNDYRKIEAAIKHLEETGEIVLERDEERTEFRGRPTEVWIYVRKKPSFQ
jgi:hypothetical protein